LTQVQGSDSLSKLNGKGFEFTVNQFVLMGHGLTDVFGINENDVEPFVYGMARPFGMLK
jgi:hypothetical protein